MIRKLVWRRVENLMSGVIVVRKVEPSFGMSYTYFNAYCCANPSKQQAKQLTVYKWVFILGAYGRPFEPKQKICAKMIM